MLPMQLATTFSPRSAACMKIHFAAEHATRCATVQARTCQLAVLARRNAGQGLAAGGCARIITTPYWEGSPFFYLRSRSQ